MTSCPRICVCQCPLWFAANYPCWPPVKLPSNSPQNRCFSSPWGTPNTTLDFPKTRPACLGWSNGAHMTEKKISPARCPPVMFFKGYQAISSHLTRDVAWYSCQMPGNPAKATQLNQLSWVSWLWGTSTSSPVTWQVGNRIRPGRIGASCGWPTLDPGPTSRPGTWEPDDMAEADGWVETVEIWKKTMTIYVNLLTESMKFNVYIYIYINY